MLNIALRAARSAGELIVRSTDRLDAISVNEKDAKDYVTEIDRAAEQSIVNALRKAYPTHGILGEEGGLLEGSGEGADYLWIIDPLDGTSNYLRGFPHYCVSIALVENGEPIDAVIFDPLRNELFTASKGNGAVLNDRRLRVSDRKDLEGTMIHTGFAPRERSRASSQLKTVDTLLVQAEDVRRTGSAALDLAYVACGRADAYFEAGVKAWDIAAGVLLVREAGGKVCNYRGAPLDRMDSRGPETQQVVAGNIKVCEALQKVIVNTGYAAEFDPKF